jgi:SAM-dependent methyltransferase
MQQQRDKTVLESYWKARQRSLQNPLGKRRAVIAAFQILKGRAKKSAQPIRIIELGCGEGHILGELSRMCASNKVVIEECVGVDNQVHAIKSARLLYPQMNFLLADYAKQPLNLQPFDLVMLIGTLHEVYSANRSIESGEIDHNLGKKAVEQALSHGVRLVGDNRHLVLFDGIEHADPALEITVQFQSTVALDEFKNLAAEYQAFRLEYQRSDGNFRTTMSMHDFTRYITKTRFFNSCLWEIEKRESYQYFTDKEFKKCLGSLGVNILKLQCSSPSKISWQKRVRIETPEVEFPKEHILIVGQKLHPHALKGDGLR